MSPRKNRSRPPNRAGGLLHQVMWPALASEMLPAIAATAATATVAATAAAATAAAGLALLRLVDPDRATVDTCDFVARHRTGRRPVPIMDFPNPELLWRWQSGPWPLPVLPLQLWKTESGFDTPILPTLSRQPSRPGGLFPPVRNNIALTRHLLPWGCLRCLLSAPDQFGFAQRRAPGPRCHTFPKLDGYRQRSRYPGRRVRMQSRSNHLQ